MDQCCFRVAVKGVDLLAVIERITSITVSSICWQLLKRVMRASEIGGSKKVVALTNRDAGRRVTSSLSTSPVSWSALWDRLSEKCLGPYQWCQIIINIVKRRLA